MWPERLAAAASPGAAGGDPLPALAAMPAMMRRRVEPLGRIALHAAYASRGADAPLPVVFASRYGDVARSITLLRQLVGGETPSPTAFSLSVHNAIGALWSIASGDTAPYTAIAAGDETVEAAFIEALGLLADGTPAAMVVCYDEPLPPPYDIYAGHADTAHAWACRVAPVDEGGFSLTSRLAGTDAVAAPADRVADRRVLEFFHSDAERLTHQAGARVWEWRRHA